WIATHAVFGGVRTRVNLTAVHPACPSHNKREPRTNYTNSPRPTLDLHQDVCQRLSPKARNIRPTAQNIPIPSVPPPVTSAPIKPLAPSPSEPHLGNDLADKPLNNNDDLAKEPLNNNDEAPGKDLAEEPLNNDDEVSLASLDDQVHTKTSEVASPPSRSTSHQSTSTEPVELVTSVNDFDYQIGEPMDPPPHKRFLSMDDLVEFVRMWAKHHGYGISKGSSHAGKNIYIRCDRGGTYTGKLENLAKRDSSTRKCECAFQVKGSTSQAKGATDRSWHLVVMTGEHNHPASHCPSAHPSHRQLTKEQMEEVRKLLKSNVKTTQILLQLRQSDPETLAIEEEPEFDLQEEISKIHLLLSHESASQLPRIFKQFHQIISTHEHAEAQLKKDQNKRAANERAAKSRKKVKWSVDEEEEEEQEMEERKKTTIKFRLPRKTIAMKAEEKGNMDEKKGDDILEDSPYFLEIPIVFWKYIRGIFNPEGDGNCGFRCIAKALGYDDDGWMQVREEMWKEAEAHRPHYSKLLGGEPTLEKILEGLGVSELTKKITLAKWLNKMDHGPMIANTYGRPVVFLSLETCGTFLPVRVGPKEVLLSWTPIYFVLVVVITGSGGITGGGGWGYTYSSCGRIQQGHFSNLKAWKSHFKQQFALYNQEVKVKGKRLDS
ncbi:hypothetical protein PSHT_07578, partial [Puccinia striiformis]